MISCYHNDLLAGHFKISKTQKLVGKKYYCLALRRNVETYVRRCDMCLASKTICHKPYRDLQ